MAYVLAIMCGRNTQDYIHVNSLLDAMGVASSHRGDFPKLRYWGFIEKQEGVKEDGNPRNGLYRITEKGIAWVLGDTKVHEVLITYNNQFYGLTGAEVTFKDVLKKKFDYTELMASIKRT